jgi:hypothetical protein
VALIYQHASQEADQGIAASVDERIRAAQRKPTALVFAGVSVRPIRRANQEADQGIAASLDEKVRVARPKPSKLNQRRPAGSNGEKQ